MNLTRKFYRTLGHFISPRLRLYLARCVFSAANKPITSSPYTESFETKMVIIFCDCLQDPNFLEFIRSQANLLRMELLTQKNYSIITLPEEHKAVYDAIAHYFRAAGIPPMVASQFEKEKLWIPEGSVR